MVTQLSARYSKRLRRHQDSSSESAAGHSLAITTMTFEHHDRLRSTFVADRAAGTATGKRDFHVILSQRKSGS